MAAAGKTVRQLDADMCTLTPNAELQAEIVAFVERVVSSPEVAVERNEQQPIFRTLSTTPESTNSAVHEGLSRVEAATARPRMCQPMAPSRRRTR